MATKATELAQFTRDIVYDEVNKTISGISASLADTAVTAGSYGSSSNVASFTVDAKGRLTAASNTAISLSSFTTTNLAEGTNLYYTTARWDTQLATKTADNLAEGSTNLYYTNTRARAAVSVTDSGGDGSLSYNNSTGVFTYTGPSATEVRAHFSAGTGVTITNGQIAIGQAVATTSNVTFADINSTGNVQIDGNLTVSGTTVTVNATNLAVEDNMIYLNNGSAVTNPDLGIAGNYNDGTYKHAGFFRDASDGYWKPFKDYTLEPDASAFIDTSHASFALADIQAANFRGTLIGSISNALTIGTGLSGTSYNGSGAVTIAIDSTVATLTGSQTLTNKTLTDSTTYFQDDVTNSKKMQFQLSSISANFTRTLTVPDTDGTIALTGNKLSAFAATTSAELAGIISDETGSGLLVFATSPSFTTDIRTPKVTTSGATNLVLDTNTGTTSGSITIAAGANGNISLVPNGTGMVGIGTSSPTRNLTVYGAGSPTIRIEESTSGGNKRLDLWVDSSTSVAYVGANQSAQQLAFQTNGNTRAIFKSALSFNSGVAGLDMASSHGIGFDESGVRTHGIYPLNGYLKIESGDGNGGLALTNSSNIIVGMGAARPTTIQRGAIYLQGETGGWSIPYGFKNNSGTYVGGFGMLGNTDSVTNFWVGPEYNNNYMTWDSSAIKSNRPHVSQNGYHWLQKELPEFSHGAGGISDEYLVLAKLYTSGGAIASSGIVGEIIAARGSSSTGNSACKTRLHITCAYQQNYCHEFTTTGSRDFYRIDIITIGGVQYYAAKARESGGESHLGRSFTGWIITDNSSILLTRVRASDANVTVVTTGAFYPAQVYTGSDNKLYIENNGSVSINILANANVGIGTATPQNRLDVRGDLGIGTGYNSLPAYTLSGSNSSSQNHSLTISGHASGTNDDVVWDLSRNGGAYGSYSIKYNSSTRFYISGGSLNNSGHSYVNPVGNFGVGDTNPGSKLTVSGSNTSSVPVAAFYATGSGAWQRGIRLQNAAMSAGDSLMITSGYADNARNQGQLYFYFAGSGSTSNRLSFGLHSVDDIINILGTGNVGIGTTSPNTKLTVESSGANGISLSPDAGSTNNSGRLFFAASGGVWTILNNSNVFRIQSAATVGSDSGTARLSIDSSGNTTITGTLTESSSITIKENVNPIVGALDAIMQLVGVTYDRKDGTAKNEPGLIAEDVNEILPNVVSRNAAGDIEGIKYTKLVAYLLESIKELKQEIDQLKGK